MSSEGMLGKVTLAKDTLKIGIVAGEHSEDILGSQLIEELSKSREIKLFGVSGLQNESRLNQCLILNICKSWVL